jgi:hypothetical protein
MNPPSIRTCVAVAALGLLTLGAAACGSSSAKSTPATQPQTTTVGSGSDSGGAPPTTSGGDTTTTVAGGVKTGHLGDTLDEPDQYVPADVASVTLVKVFDPATPVDASDVPTPGNRWVGLEMTIVDNGDNAAKAVQVARIFGSDGKNYDSGAGIDDSFTGCTSTMQHAPQPNQKATFCPGFLLPNGVTVTKVGYTTTGLEGLPAAITWTVP